MRRRWLRLPPGRRDNALAASVALGAAAGVAAAVFYLGRLFFSREEITARDADGGVAPSPVSAGFARREGAPHGAERR